MDWTGVERIPRHLVANWTKAPDWAEWFAVDENGEGYFYNISPMAMSDLRDWSCWLPGGLGGRSSYAGNYELGGFPYVQTLQARGRENRGEIMRDGLIVEYVVINISEEDVAGGWSVWGQWREGSAMLASGIKEQAKAREIALKHCPYVIEANIEDTRHFLRNLLASGIMDVAEVKNNNAKTQGAVEAMQKDMIEIQRELITTLRAQRDYLQAQIDRNG